MKISFTLDWILFILIQIFYLVNSKISFYPSSIQRKLLFSEKNHFVEIKWHRVLFSSEKGIRGEKIFICRV